MEAGELALFGVASDGRVRQWDGLPTPSGILLRWLPARGLGFPDYGYDLYSSRVADVPALAWQIIAPFATGQTSYNHAGEISLQSEMGLQFTGVLNETSLVVQPGDRLTFTFPDAAYFLSIEPAPNIAGTITAEVFAGGVSREVRRLTSGDPPWMLRTRGVERVELLGDGAVRRFHYGLVNAPRRWMHLHHLCLPIHEQAYPCSPQAAGSEEDEAKSRVPSGVDWEARYSTAFRDLLPYLHAFGQRAESSFPASSDPDAPQFGMAPEEAILLAALDPHIARMLGLAWDDPIPLDGTEWAYKVVGRWKGPIVTVALQALDALVKLSESGVRVGIDWETIEVVDGGLTIRPSREKPLLLDFADPKDVLAVRFRAGNEGRWQAYDNSRQLLASGSFGPFLDAHDLRRGTELRIEVPGMQSVELVGQTPLTLYAISFAGPPIERLAILPSIHASDPGPPESSAWLTARPEHPGGAAEPLQAALTWELNASSAGDYEENACILHQVAAYQLSTDPLSTPPPVPPFQELYLLNSGRPVFVPSEVIVAPQPPARYYTDTDLSEGWRCWWVRGIDLFGRVSDVSPADKGRLEDSALPPAPVILHAEYAQANMPAQHAALIWRSWLCREWLATNSIDSGVVVFWGWSPELADLAPDVDGFRVYVRRPAAVPNPGPHDPERQYTGVPWGSTRAEIGPIAVRLDGQVVAMTTFVPGVTVTAVTPIDDEHAVCTTNLDLDSGGSAFVGSVVQAGTLTYTIVSHGEGQNVSFTVKHPKNAQPSLGAYEIQAGVASLVRVETDLMPAGIGTSIRQLAGALVAGNERLMVIGRSGGSFLCRFGTGTTLPSIGDDISWFPSYAAVIRDTGFGPAASPSEPVANAQVTVHSVRRWSSRQLESPDAAPGLLTSVDATPAPPPPPLDPIPSGPYCAEVATRSDWYGVSRFVLSWAPAAGVGYVVYRALGDAINQLDLAARIQGTTPLAHNFPQDVWPVAMWNDPDRQLVVQSDLAALDAAIAGGSAQAIETAYAALHADTQQLIAGQQQVEGAYAALNGTPLTADDIPFVDELDGRSRAHWFYRIASRTSSGLEGIKGPPTPPICCPDVVPPAQPLAQLALADINGSVIRLQWQISPERDLARYLIYRAADETSAADVRAMTLVARITTSTAGTPGTDEVAPIAVTGKQWLEYADLTPGGHEWFYRIIAEDISGNQSEPSKVLRGRAIVPPPVPPVWDPPTRDGTSVTLTWTHPRDQRLACLIERRHASGGYWSSVSGWLPRGLYIFHDTPPEVSTVWDYRLRIRDQLHQVASELPQIQVEML